MGSYVSAAEPPQVTRQPAQAEAWLEEAAHLLTEQNLRQDFEKLSEQLRQGGFKKGCFNCIVFVFVCLFVFVCIFTVKTKQTKQIEYEYVLEVGQ